MVFQEEGGTPERAPRVADARAPRKEDRLMTQATGQGRVEVPRYSETEFFLTVTDAQTTFVKGPSGTVDSIVLHQGGRDLPAKRKK